MLYLNGVAGTAKAVAEDLTLTSVVFEFIIVKSSPYCISDLTLTSVVFESISRHGPFGKNFYLTLTSVVSKSYY